MERSRCIRKLKAAWDRLTADVAHCLVNGRYLAHHAAAVHVEDSRLPVSPRRLFKSCEVRRGRVDRPTAPLGAAQTARSMSIRIDMPMSEAALRDRQCASACNEIGSATHHLSQMTRVAPPRHGSRRGHRRSGVVPPPHSLDLMSTRSNDYRHGDDGDPFGGDSFVCHNVELCAVTNDLGPGPAGGKPSFRGAPRRGSSADR